MATKYSVTEPQAKLPAVVRAERRKIVCEVYEKTITLMRD